MDRGAAAIYARTQTIRPDDWFFDGHFKNDSCMPGTLMFEGCLQTMALYLASLGYSLDRDGWRFEPILEETYALRCRGQVLPSSRELVYEVFVDEVIDGDTPKLYADILCTVDGLKAFHCRRMGLQLTPDWPLEKHRASIQRSSIRPTAPALMVYLRLRIASCLRMGQAIGRLRSDVRAL